MHARMLSVTSCSVEETRNERPMYVLLTKCLGCSFCLGKTDVEAICVLVAQKLSHALYHELVFADGSDDIVRCRRDARRCQSELL